MLVAQIRKNSYAGNNIGERKTQPLVCQHLSIKGSWFGTINHGPVVTRGVFNNVSRPAFLREVYLEFENRFQHPRVASTLIPDAGPSSLGSPEQLLVYRAEDSFKFCMQFHIRDVIIPFDTICEAQGVILYSLQLAHLIFACKMQGHWWVEQVR